MNEEVHQMAKSCYCIKSQFKNMPDIQLYLLLIYVESLVFKTVETGLCSCMELCLRCHMVTILLMQGRIQDFF